MQRLLMFWDRAGREEDCLGRRRQYSSDPTTSLNGNADREVGQPDSSVRAGSLQAGADLPCGVSVPGALAGGRASRAASKNIWGELGAKQGRGRVYGCFRRDTYH